MDVNSLILMERWRWKVRGGEQVDETEKGGGKRECDRVGGAG